MEQSIETNSKKVDVYQLVTDTIIQQLESGIIPWQKPWKGSEGRMLDFPSNSVTGNRYRGINILLLWSSAIRNNFETSEWASFKQWKAKNEMIRKGEKGNLIVYYDTFAKDVEGEIQNIPFLKTSVVFNRSQLQSFIADEKKENPYSPSLIEKIDEVDSFLEPLNLNLSHWDKGPCYIPSKDCIQMPYPEQFESTPTCSATEGYYSAMLHEVTHWTGHQKRLNRDGGKRFGDQAYAFEELVAEFGAAFLCSGFGLSTLDKGDHAAYIEGWLKVFKENKKIIFSAASEASKATQYLFNLN